MSPVGLSMLSIPLVLSLSGQSLPTKDRPYPTNDRIQRPAHYFTKRDRLPKMASLQKTTVLKIPCNRICTQEQEQCISIDRHKCFFAQGRIDGLQQNDVPVRWTVDGLECANSMDSCLIGQHQALSPHYRKMPTALH